MAFAPRQHSGSSDGVTDSEATSGEVAPTRNRERRAGGPRRSFARVGRITEKKSPRGNLR